MDESQQAECDIVIIDPAGTPKDACDYCGRKAEYDEDGHSNLNATYTHTDYVTLCGDCKRKAGNTVR